MNVLLGVTGSVAAIYTEKLAQAFIDDGHQVRIVLTQAARQFTTASKFATFTDELEWDWSKMGDPVQHIELRNWMDVLLIAPLTANTMAKMVNGMCDNLLTSVWLAHGTKPVIVAPAMNTHMLMHSITQRNICSLLTMGVGIIGPVEKKLACGDVGIGALAPHDVIVNRTKEFACAQ